MHEPLGSNRALPAEPNHAGKTAEECYGSRKYHHHISIIRPTIRRSFQVSSWFSLTDSRLMQNMAEASAGED